MASPVRVMGHNKRTDFDVNEGAFTKAVSGPNVGVVGVLHEAKTYNTGGDGYPLTAVVVEALTGRFLSCAYSDLRPAVPGDRVRQ